MDGWTPLGQVSWWGKTLVTFAVTRTFLERTFGPPHHRNIDSNGVGEIDAWLYRLPCGLEIVIWLYGANFDDFGPIEDPDAPHHAEVRANRPSPRHVLAHLPWITPIFVAEGQPVPPACAR